MTSKVTGTLGGLPVEGDPASDTLEVSAAFLPPGFSKSFAPYLIDTGETSSLTFTINNTSNTEREATNLGFTDNLPAGVIVAPAPNASTTWRGGTVTATPGTGVNGHMIGNVTYNVNRADEDAVVTVTRRRRQK